MQKSSSREPPRNKFTSKRNDSDSADKKLTIKDFKQ